MRAYGARSHRAHGPVRDAVGWGVREWLMGLTRPEDRLLWAWLVIVLGYAAVGAMLGFRARRRASAPNSPPPRADPDSR